MLISNLCNWILSSSHSTFRPIVMHNIMNYSIIYNELIINYSDALVELKLSLFLLLSDCINCIYNVFIT